MEGTAYAVDVETGAERWRRTLQEPVRLGLAFDPEGGLLLAAGNAGTLYALDPTDGHIRWSQPGNGQIGSMILRGDRVYISRIYADEHVQAIRVEDGQVQWAFSPAESQQ